MSRRHLVLRADGVKQHYYITSRNLHERYVKVRRGLYTNRTSEALHVPEVSPPAEPEGTAAKHFVVYGVAKKGTEYVVLDFQFYTEPNTSEQDVLDYVRDKMGAEFYRIGMSERVAGRYVNTVVPLEDYKAAVDKGVKGVSWRASGKHRSEVKTVYDERDAFRKAYFEK